ncbi:MAG TPA: Sec-independent protein translocase protein TatB [Xanthobacteraceae bacterium]|jgi:sec-independent protein translocase protein TatB
MFELDWGKLVVIGIVALVVIGPKDLPAALRTLGQWMGKLRRMASEFQTQFQEAMREAEMADLKKQVDEMASQAQSYTSFDPIADVGKDLERTQQQIEGAIAETPGAAQAASTPAVPAASADSHSMPAAGTETQVAAPSAPSEPEPLAPPEPAKLDAGNRPA